MSVDRSKKATEERHRIIRVMAAEGYNARQIAEKVGMSSPAVVMSHCRREGITLTPMRPTESGEVRAERIDKMAKEGYTLAQIAAAEGVSKEQVSSIASQWGINIKATAVVGRRPAISSIRILRETIQTLEGACQGVGLLNLNSLDQSEWEEIVQGEWEESLADSLRVLNRLARTLKEKIQRDE